MVDNAPLVVIEVKVRVALGSLVDERPGTTSVATEGSSSKAVVGSFTEGVEVVSVSEPDDVNSGKDDGNGFNVASVDRRSVDGVCVVDSSGSDCVVNLETDAIEVSEIGVPILVTSVTTDASVVAAITVGTGVRLIHGESEESVAAREEVGFVVAIAVDDSAGPLV